MNQNLLKMRTVEDSALQRRLHDFTFLRQKGRMVTFMIMLVALAHVQVAQAFTFQDPITVTGTVTDPTGMPLPGASVQEKGTSNGVVTDFDGNYSIEVASEESILVVSYVGMATQEIAVTVGTPVDIQLDAEAENLAEVVLIGYGSQQRKAVSTAVTKVKTEDFNQGATNSPLDLIQGKVAGLSITRSNGNNPNGSTSIQLRGLTSVRGDTSPLIVIDGIPGGNLDLLQQNDIESFDVLKDGGAAAIYGTRGNNGVILITTKKGKKGKTTFEYYTQISRDFVNQRPDFLTADEYREAINTLGESPNLDLGYNTDIYDELINKSNLTQYHNFVASGSGENSSYRASFYINDQEGIAIENGRFEYGYRISFNQSMFDDKLKFQSSLATNFNDANLLGGSQFGIVQDWNPTAPIYAPYNEGINDDLQNPGQYGFYQPNNGYNPFSEYANRINERQQQTFSGDAKLSYELTDGLIAAVFGSYQRNTWNDRQYRSKEDWAQYGTGSSYLGTAYAYKSNRLDYTRTVEPTLTYTHQFGDHGLEALAGYSYQYHTQEDFSMNNSGFTTDAFMDWNFRAGNAIRDTDLPRPDLGSFKEDNTLVAFFGRISYNYLEKYYLQASIRREGSSRFGENNKWGNFPAVSASWLISDEDFMQDSGVINFLKLRASYGVTGNQGIDNYQSLVTLNTGGFYPIFLGDDTEGTFYQTYGAAKNPNPNLKWETKKEINVGVDFGFFQNRLNGSLDVYDRKTEDLLDYYSVPQPPFVRGNILTNVGSISNQGIELVLGYDLIKGKDFTWHMDFTANYQKNILESLSNEDYIASEIYGGGIGNPGNLGNAIRVTEGGPIGQFYGKRFAGFTDEGEWQFYAADGSIVGTDEVSDEDYAILGNGMPKWFASWTNSFKYKNVDLTVFFRGKFDYDILNTVDLFYGNPNIFPQNNILSSAVNKNISEAPQYSDYYLEKGDFVKLDNITLGYTFNLRNDSALSKLRAFASARNLATFTGYSGLDPELEDTGLFPGINYRQYYPRTTTVTLGLNIAF